MADKIFDVCVIGAGSGGLSVAYGASHMGASVALIEGHKMGGDCLNFGCVPSKALLAAGHTAHAMRHADRFGIKPVEAEVDFAAVTAHIKDVIATIEPNDSVERYQGFGIDVITEHARFTGPDRVEAGGRTIRARRFVVATGSSAAVPPIPGLDKAPFFTNETIFDNTERPDHLLIIGGGPIGCEMAQAHRHLGSRVTILDMANILPKDDPELVEVVKKSLVDDGVELLEHIKVNGISGQAGRVTVTYEKDGTALEVEGSHLLVAAGRKPNITDLGLEAAGIAYERSGITVDQRLRTSNKKVFAIGDCAGGFQFTHLANYHAGIVIRNVLLRLPAKVNTSALPWVTYTDPEMAHVGQTEADARKEPGDVTVLRFPYHENDRAIAERTTEGFVKVVTNKKGKILGASIVGAHAGELLQPWVLAMSSGLKIGAMAGMIVAYPTLGEINKRAAGSFYTPKVFGDGMKRVVRFLSKFG
ncbi:MAG: dihydrolipoyl dehydrogenase family protein [Alphaproteobacteria bacterium]|jgi:pyruvate/2-oxoglutarate dehydrogenase complex dihydrolipoamide dehydrogenase (E3) component